MAAPGQRRETAARPQAAALDAVEPVDRAVASRRFGQAREDEPPVKERGRRLGHDRPVGLGAQEEPLESIPGAPLAVELEPDFAARSPNPELGDMDAHADGDSGRLGLAVALDGLADRHRRVRRPAESRPRRARARSSPRCRWDRDPRPGPRSSAPSR